MGSLEGQIPGQHSTQLTRSLSTPTPLQALRQGTSVGGGQGEGCQREGGEWWEGCGGGGNRHLQLLGYSASSRPLPRCPEYKAASVQDIRAYNPGWGGTFRDQPQPARGLASPSPPRISTSDPHLGINHPSEFVHSTELRGRADVGTAGAEISGHAAPGPPTQRAIPLLQYPSPLS